MAQNKNSLKNLSKQSFHAHANGVKAFTSRLNCLSEIVSERKTNFIPMGDLPSAIKAFYESDEWIPNSKDKESMKISKNIVYAKHEQNEILFQELNQLIAEIKKPRSSKKVLEQQTLEIQKLEDKVRVLCAENLRIELKYQQIIDKLKTDLQVSESIRNRYKQLLENNADVIQFPTR